MSKSALYFRIGFVLGGASALSAEAGLDYISLFFGLFSALSCVVAVFFSD